MYSNSHTAVTHRFLSSEGTGPPGARGPQDPTDNYLHYRLICRLFSERVHTLTDGCLPLVCHWTAVLRQSRHAAGVV